MLDATIGKPYGAHVGQTTANIGGNIKRVREAAGLRQEDVADAARACGVRWGRSAVAMLEGGHYSNLGVDELLALPKILEQAGAGPVSLYELLVDDDDAVEITDRLSITRAGLAQLLDPRRRRPADGWSLHFGTKDQQLLDAATSPEMVRKLAALEELAAGEAERKAARKLGVDAVDVVSVAWDLWGMSLTAKRDELVAAEAPDDASPRTIQALRAHATRRLIAELAPNLEEH